MRTPYWVSVQYWNKSHPQKRIVFAAMKALLRTVAAERIVAYE